jgi:phage anti-repressor protein
MDSIKVFLKTHSAIPNAFIDDFINMNSYKALQTDFAIDLDVVAKWLSVKKGNLIETLKKTYKLDIDYTLQNASNKKGKYGGNHYKKVMITPDCFKRLCMLSRSAKAEDVRTYYIHLEALLFKYHQQMLEGMQAEIKNLEKALKPKNGADSTGYIYVLRASKEKDSVYKIGRTKDLNKRLSTYQTDNLENIEVVYKYRTDNLKSMENCVKHALGAERYRKYKEIYKVDIQMIKEIIEKCNDIENIKIMYTMRKASKMDGGYYVGLFPAP